MKASKACVAWPLTSLMPKISDEGNEACTETARDGAEAAASSTGVSYEKGLGLAMAF